MSPFETETAVQPVGDGRYGIEVSGNWSVPTGPNGGYVAALILRALTAEVGDDTRAPRSLTIHYLSAAREGAAEVQVTTERTGRSLTSLTARLVQGDRLIAIATAAFSSSRSGVEFCDLTMPSIPGPEHYRAPKVPADALPIARRWDTRWAIGRPRSPMNPGPAADRAVAGGWIRLPELQPIDAMVAAAITDAWMPPVFSKVDEMIAVPTVDLTIHFRTALPLASLAADDFVLAVFRTNVIADGFLEEDGEVWAPDGTLIAQSRQLAVVLPFG